MIRKIFNYFKIIRDIQYELGQVDEKILQLEQRIHDKVHILKNHLIRVKNHEELSDGFIEQERSYQDLSPEKAWKIYSNQDANFVILDVSSSDANIKKRLSDCLHIPLEYLHDRFYEISSKTVPILVISEDGTKSILACDFLIKKGFYNCNNISGGYRFWPGFKDYSDSPG